MKLSFLSLCVALVVVLGGCRAAQPKLIWDVPGYREFADARCYELLCREVGRKCEMVVGPWPDVSKDVRLSAFQQANVLFDEVYKDEIEKRQLDQPKDNLINLLDLYSARELIREPNIFPYYQRYVETGVLYTHRKKYPKACERHVQLDALADTPGSEWTHERPAVVTDEGVTSFRLRKKNMPVVR